MYILTPTDEEKENPKIYMVNNKKDYKFNLFKNYYYQNQKNFFNRLIKIGIRCIRKI